MPKDFPDFINPKTGKRYDNPDALFPGTGKPVHELTFAEFWKALCAAPEKARRAYFIQTGWIEGNSYCTPNTESYTRQTGFPSLAKASKRRALALAAGVPDFKIPWNTEILGVYV